MPTKQELIQAGVEAGYGSAQHLGAQFVSWQKAGLIGQAEAKETGRKGGAGLWHRMQLAIWLNLLRQRSDGRRLPTLANLPVGIWLLGWDGVTLDQVQRAFRTWVHPAVSGRRPPGGRSLVDAGIRERVDELSAPTASRTARRELKRAYQRIVEAADPFHLPGQPFVDALLQAAVPAARHSIPQRQFAESIWHGIRLQSVTIRHVESILIQTPEVRAFWNWAARQIRRSLGEYVADLDQLQSDSDFGRLFGRPGLNEFLNSSCSNVSTIMGAGIAVLQGYDPYATPEGYEPAPHIRLT